MESTAKQWIKAIAVFLLITISLVNLPGCWNRVELNDRALALGLALDKAPGVDNKFMMTAEIANPSEVIAPLTGGGGGELPPAWVVSSTGWSAWEAGRNIVMQSRRRLFVAHTQVFVIGEDIAKEGLSPLMDLIMRNRELRRTAWIIIAKEATGKEILGVQHEMGGLTSDVINNLVLDSVQASAAIQIEVADFIQELVCDKCSPVAGRIEFVDPGRPEGIIDETETRDMKENITEGELLRYSGAAVFKRDRLVGWLDRKEARGLNWIRDNIGSGILVVKAPGEPERNLGIDVMFSESNISIEFTNDKPKITIEVEVEGNLGENMSNQDIIDKESLQIVEKRMAQVVRNDIEAVLKKAQELETDIFGFAMLIYQSNYKKWQELEEDWEKTFSNLPIGIVVQADVRRIGLIGEPVRAR